ncbi:hypothetical protein BGX23_003855 [Mortierella sp. AD031]|nr:hypothetical protein BGX23_003855 [Mortierella sp. AD031]
MDKPMGELREFHRERIGSLLRRQKQHCALPSGSDSADTKTDTDSSKPKRESAANIVLSTPELVAMIFEYLPTRRLVKIAFLCKLWFSTFDPIAWRHLVFRQSSTGLRRLAHCGDWVQSIQFGTPETEIALIDLSAILPLTPRLTSIDLINCETKEHPLTALAPYQQLESIAFKQHANQVITMESSTDVFAAWPRLKLLCIFSQSLLEARGAQVALERAILSSTSLHRLQTIQLCGLIHWLPSTLVHMVRTNLDHLLSFELNCPLYHFKSEIATALAGSPRLESLGIHNCLPDITSTSALKTMIETHPRLKCLSLTIWTLRSVILAPLMQKCQSLVALRLERCYISYRAIRLFLMNCPHLRELRLLSLREMVSMDLFRGEPWVCRGLEELRIDCLSNEFLTAEAKDQATQTMWGKLETLTRLRFLVLTFVVRGSPKGLHLTKVGLRNKDRIKDKDKEKIKEGKGWKRLKALEQMEQLGLMGYGAWGYADVAWLADSFPRLLEYWYEPEELETPNRAWLRKARPGLELVPCAQGTGRSALFCLSL